MSHVFIELIKRWKNKLELNKLEFEHNKTGKLKKYSQKYNYNRSINTLKFNYFYLFFLYIYLNDLQESNGSANT